MAKKPWLVFDMDDTVVEFCRLVHDRFNERLGTQQQYHEQPDYDLTRRFGLQNDADLYANFIACRIYEDAEPTAGVPEAIQYVHSLGFGIHFVTARGFLSNGHQLTVDWLNKHNVPYDRVTITRYKERKAQHFHEDTRAVVEDSVEQLKHTRDCVKVLVRRPWNMHLQCSALETHPEDLHRVIRNLSILR